MERALAKAVPGKKVVRIDSIGFRVNPHHFLLDDSDIGE
jgi:hypothetical protein